MGRSPSLPLDSAGGKFRRWGSTGPRLRFDRARRGIVPDGALHALNFETLPAAGSPRRYWIEDVEIQIARSRAPRTAARSLQARSPPVAAIRHRGVPLPRPCYASAEMSSIVRHFDGAASRTYAGEQASPREFRSARPEQFSLVHFTAHATANRESPLDSAVILSGPDDGYKLYARDVADLPLQAELVTVSACRSAGERVYAGEGLVGFAWAFLRAGARRVIAGLGRRRSLHGRSDGCDVRAAGRRRFTAAGAARRQARPHRARRRRGEAVLLGTLSGIHGLH